MIRRLNSVLPDIGGLVTRRMHNFSKDCWRRVRMTRHIAGQFVRGAALVAVSLGMFAAGCNKAEETPAASNTPNEAAPAAGASPSKSPASISANTTSAQGVPVKSNVEMPSPIILMKTSLGDIHLKLNPKAAPRTVSNFVDYVVTKHYDGTIIHQIDGGYALLGGTYDEKLQAKAVRYPIPNESATSGLKNKKGTIAMAHKPNDPNGATSQFFINLSDNPKLDRKGDKPEDAGYCVFGEVVQGLDVLEKISQVQTATVKGFEKMPVQTVSVQTMKLMR